MTQTLEGSLDASGVRVALIVSRFNEVITSRLLQGAEDCFDRHGGSPEDRTVYRVPGSWEIPQAAGKAVKSGKYDAVVTLGALIRGETPHFDHLAGAVTRGLTRLSMESEIPVIYGILTTDSVEQAIDRAGAKMGNKGWAAAQSALEMVGLYRRMA
jgi:6,7-dimethyl-8-ribityllumazine synthase